ncbi:MAG: helix-turn-helix domain-containing protein, partial [Prosthecobacter sp.]|nr:helix-turn-helix domain-containing protein [Prosthecobacter sp.]
GGSRMNAETPCPCCGQTIAPANAPKWNENSRTIVVGDGVAVLTPMQARMFSMLWRAWPSGRLISVEQMMNHLYADDPNGGPEYHNTVSVQISHMRKKLEPLGLTIRGRHGYAISRLVERVAA